MPYADWAGVRRDLARALDVLGDREFLVLGEASSGPRPRWSWHTDRHSRRLPGPVRYVQALRVEEVLTAECVGATSHGGNWEMSEASVEQLRSLGWLTPPELRSAYAIDSRNFMVHLEQDATLALADLMVASLAVLGARPAHLVLAGSQGLPQSCRRLSAQGDPEHEYPSVRPVAPNS